MKQVQASSKEMEDYYQNNKEKFGQPKRVKVRHILIRADAKDAEATAKAKQKAESIQKEAEKGKDFAQLAKQYSEDPGTKDRGGDLGYVTKGKVVPEFEQEAFSLKVGEISKVVQTPYGFHILKVDEIQEAKAEPLEKVKDQIDALFRNRKTRDLAYDLADQAYAVASKDKKLDGFAKEKKLTIKETGLFSAEDKIDLDPKLKAAALSLSKGDISPALRVGETFAVLQVVDRQEARIPELKDVEGQVSEALTKGKTKGKGLGQGQGGFGKVAKRGGSKVPGRPGGVEGGRDRVLPQECRSPQDVRFGRVAEGLASSWSLKNPYAENPIFHDGKFLIIHLREKRDR